MFMLCDSCRQIVNCYTGRINLMSPNTSLKENHQLETNNPRKYKNLVFDVCTVNGLVSNDNY